MSGKPNSEPSIEDGRMVARATSCGCRSWWCSSCAYRKGAIVREYLKAYLLWIGWQPYMVTVTFDPKLFKSPKEAYLFGRKLIGRYVHELDRRGVLASRDYFAVLKFHKSGWPHWHILLNTSYVSIDTLRTVWNGFGRRIGADHLGIVDFRKKKGWLDIESALAYLTKYLTKTPKEGWPDWLLDTDLRVRRYSASQSIKLSLQAGVARESEPESDGEIRDSGEGEVVEQKERKRSGKTHRMRVRECGGKCVVHAVYQKMLPDGEIWERKRFLCVLADSLSSIGEAFGYFVEDGQKVLDLEGMGVEQFKGVCDAVKMKRLRESEYSRNNRWATLKPKRQRALVEV